VLLRYLIRNRFSRWGRVGLICLTLLGFAIGTVGIPLPVPVPSGPNPEQFICQGHGCGCQTAEHCWKACCCFSPKKRLEWAAKHEIEMPFALVDQLLDDAEKKPGEPLCAAPSLLAGSDTHRLTKLAPSDGAAKADRPSKHRPARQKGSSDSQKNSDGVTWYSVILARKCQGAGSTLLLLSDPLSVPATSDDWQTPEFTQSLVPESEPLLCSLFWTPPVPPG
jgi:hypothetical protein